LDPFERFLGLLGFEEEYLRWWRGPLRWVVVRDAAAFGACVNNDDWAAAEEATRRTVSGSMIISVVDASIDVHNNGKGSSAERLGENSKRSLRCGGDQGHPQSSPKKATALATEQEICVGA